MLYQLNKNIWFHFTKNDLFYNFKTEIKMENVCEPLNRLPSPQPQSAKQGMTTKMRAVRLTGRCQLGRKLLYNISDWLNKKN